MSELENNLNIRLDKLMVSMDTITRRITQYHAQYEEMLIQSIKLKMDIQKMESNRGVKHIQTL